MFEIQVKLGLWIDLTFTSRFYNKTIVEDKNINYCKFQCRGYADIDLLMALLISI